MPGSPSHTDVGEHPYNEVELPSSIEIRESSVAAGQAGAFSKILIKKNTRFGPYKGEIIKPGQKADIDYRYAWEIFEKRRNVLKYTISASDPKASNWMRNVNCARFYEEQNIVSTQEGFSIFYVAMKDIRPGEELLTWFDPQLLKRSQRRTPRGEKKKIGYTIELVPWTDEKKFVPEIIETKRARKKKVLGDDMLCFEEDAALMQKSMNSMFRNPRKVETNTQPRKDNVFSPSSFTINSNSTVVPEKEIIKTSSNELSTEKKRKLEIKDDSKGLNQTTMINPQFRTTQERTVSKLSIPHEKLKEKGVSVLSNVNGASLKSPQKYEREEPEQLRKRRRRGRCRGVKMIMGENGKKRVDSFMSGSRNSENSLIEYDPFDPNCLKPVVIRTKDNGIFEMEDHDETYNIPWTPIRQDCDDLCTCMDKHGILKQDGDSSSSVHKGSQDLIVQFTLLPEHQTVLSNNKVIYKCDICECSYNHAFSLKRHYLGVHINHRYISKADADYCQLETVHSGLNDEFSKDSKHSVNQLHVGKKELDFVKDYKSSTSACEEFDPKENVSSLQGSTCSLLCNEVTLDSSTDEGRGEVPKLSSLARAQCDKMMVSTSSLSVENQNLVRDKLHESHQQSIQKCSESDSSRLEMSQNLSESGVCGEIESEQENDEKKNSGYGTAQVKESVGCASSPNIIEDKGNMSTESMSICIEKDELTSSRCENNDKNVRDIVSVPNDAQASKDFSENNDIQMKHPQYEEKVIDENVSDKGDELPKNQESSKINKKEKVDEIDEVKGEETSDEIINLASTDEKTHEEEVVRKQDNNSETMFFPNEDKNGNNNSETSFLPNEGKSGNNNPETSFLPNEDKSGDTTSETNFLPNEDKSGNNNSETNFLPNEDKSGNNNSETNFLPNEDKSGDINSETNFLPNEDKNEDHNSETNFLSNKDHNSETNFVAKKDKSHENEKCGADECQTNILGGEESAQIKMSRPVEGNESCRENSQLHVETSQASNVDKTVTEVKTQQKYVSIIPKGVDEKPNVQKLSISSSLLPIQTTNMIQTNNIKSPQTQQQFLLLVPIGAASNKITSGTIPSSSLTLPTSQGSLPLVVLSSQVSSTTTTMHLQSPTFNPQLCPQILAKPCQSLTTVSPSSSNLGQRFALIPQNPQTLINNNVQLTSIANNNLPPRTLGVPVAPPKCTIQNQNTKQLSSMSNSMSNQSISKPLADSTPNGDNLKPTLKVQEADQPGDLYRCHMCVLVYKTVGELKHHIKNDPHRFKGGIKQYACPKCSVRFRNKANLARHTLMHHQVSDEKDRKFRCSTCGKGFTSETYLKMHARFHTGKSFPCKYGCVDAFFPNAGSLVKHLRAVHPGLNLKEYLKEKKRMERMKLPFTSSTLPTPSIPSSVPAKSNVSEYSITNPGVGFQAKRGRPKGSKNIPKELKALKMRKSSTTVSSVKEQQMEITECPPGFEKPTPTEMYPPVKKYYPIEKTWQKGSSFFKISTDENNHGSRSSSLRKFPCKLCNASFKSHLFLLKHRSKRHRAGQSVQEFLFEMARDREEDSSKVVEETLQMSPPPSPKTFFSNVNQRGTENMTKYIEGGEEMLKSRKKLSFEIESPVHSLSSRRLEWTHYNFPPCFKYMRDNTIFYHNVAHDKVKPKVENCEHAQEVDNHAQGVEGDKEINIDLSIVKIDENGESKDKIADSNSHCDEKSGLCEDNVIDDVKKIMDKEKISVSECETVAKDCNETNSNADSDISNIDKSVDEQNKSVSTKTHKDLDVSIKEATLLDSEKDKEQDSNVPPHSESKSDAILGDKSKGLKRTQRKTRAEIEDMIARLNTMPLKALDLEIGSKYAPRHFNQNTISVLDSLNLFSKDGNELWNHRGLKRRKRERFSSVSSCSQLLPSKMLCRRDQLSFPMFSSPEVKEPRRYSMWQAPNCNKVDAEYSDKFCCPVVETVRQQEMSKKRKEIEERNQKEVIDIKPREKRKEEFASIMGLLSRREYERSYHAQKKKEHCIKPPEIWERYDRIWFGKKGTITVVCSICHRHFSCFELCLRHQLKKHPHIEPSSLEMEKDNYVEDMYYYYPMPYGILAQTRLIPEKMPPPELYVCTRCRFPFKNINKLYSHIVACDPNNVDQPVVTKNQPVPVARNLSVVEPVKERLVTKTVIHTHTPSPPVTSVTKPQRQRSLNSKYKSYQIFYNSMKTVSHNNPNVNTENKAYPSSASFIPEKPSVKPQSFMSFSPAIQRRKKNQNGLLYNPSNHTRRREMVHVLDQHQCHGCNLKFKSMSMLERHVKKCSGKDKLKNQKPLLSGVTDEMMVRKQHTCRYCNKRFTFIKGVDLHYKRICAVRKVREEENKLTEEDLAHEAELQRIIEHLKWSKSLNQDSTDIIQGRVKVEEDGTLTRVVKKRGRPFGRGKRIRRKGFRWTTLKYHKADDENSITSNEPISSVGESLSNDSLETKPLELSQSPVKKNPVKDRDKTEEKMAYVFSILDKPNTPVKDRDEKEEKPSCVFSILDIPREIPQEIPKEIPRKRGRPFKNRQLDSSIEQPKRKRGRPSRKDKQAETLQQDSVKTVMTLKDSINFKRGELTKENLIDVKIEKSAPLSVESNSKANKSSEFGESKNVCVKQSDSTSKGEAPLTVRKAFKAEKNIPTVSGKRKIEHIITVKETVVKPPARVRGRPKKFDPSDLESSYKKRKKTDPGYVPLIKRANKESTSNDSQTDVEDSNTQAHSDKMSKVDGNMEDESSQGIEIFKDDAQKSGNKIEASDSEQNILNSKKNLTSKMKSDHSEISPINLNSTEEIKKSLEPTASKGISDVSASASVVPTESSNFSSSQEQNSPSNHSKSDQKKSGHPGSPIEDFSMKKTKTSELQEPEKKIISKKKELSKSPSNQQHPIVVTSSHDSPTHTSLPASQDGHAAVTTASSAPNGDVVQTPVAVRVIALPLSPLAPTVPSNKILSPSSSSPMPIQPLSPISTVVTSPLLKLAIPQSPKSLPTDKSPLSPRVANTSLLSSMTTTTCTATAKSPNTPIQNMPQVSNSNNPILPSQTFPVRHILPISNQNILIPPEAIHQAVAGPRYVIHSAPRIVTPNPRQRLPVPVPIATTLTRHVSPSTVILSTGKVVALGNPMLPASGIAPNTVVQHGPTVVKKISTINPITSISPPAQQFLPNLPRPMIRKGMGMGIVVEPPKSALQGVTSPASASKPVYYVQTTPLSNQVVVPISTIKGATSPSNNQVLLNLKDGKNLNTLAVPRYQFIPMPLVQGIGQAAQITSQSQGNSAGVTVTDNMNTSNSNNEGNYNS